MRFLSVAERELRVTARRPWFYRARWLTALAFFGLLLWLAWLNNLHLNRRAAREVFEIFSVFVFLYCLFVGATSTADCLSREKREGTLGLLFLTNLNSLEITAGKICSSSLTLLYSLLAIFPLLALPLLLGGITAGDFWNSVLALVNALWFAMALGFLASALCVRQFPAVALASGLALFGGIIWLGLMKLLADLGLPSEIADLLGKFCPLKTLNLAWQSRNPFIRSDYWSSLFLANMSATAILALVSWSVARSWRDRPKSPQRFWPSRKTGPSTPSEARRAFRRRLLDINPFFWLGSRQRISAPVFMVLGIVMVGFTIWGTVPFFVLVVGTSASAQVTAQVIAWLWTGLALHALTLYYAASAASQRLAEDRQTGALELILGTPADARMLSRGLWLAYWRRMMFPVLLTTAVHFYFIWLGAQFLIFDPVETLPHGTTATELLWGALTQQRIHGQTLHWAYSFMLHFLLLGWLLAVIAWVSLGWLGRWLGLAMKRPGFAPLVALAVSVIPPIVLFSIACYVADKLDFDQLPEQMFLNLMLGLGFGIGAANLLGLALWAATHLRRNFRPIVIGRDLPECRRALWRTSLLALARVGGGFVVLLVVAAVAVFLYIANANSQSRQRWAEFKRNRVADLSLAKALPPPVADADNFVTAPAFQTVLNRKPQDASALALGNSSIGLINPSTYYYSANDPNASWLRQTPMDFEEQLQTPRPQNAAKSGAAAAKVLARLEGLQKDLDAVASAAAERRGFMLKNPRDRSAVLEMHSQPLQLLETLHGYFAVRACARLGTNVTDAFADAMTALRLTQLAAQAIDLSAAPRAQRLAGHSLQPIWEGLRAHAWNDTQLAALQSELARINLLVTYTNQVDRTARAYIELWDKFGHTPVGHSLSGATFYRSGDQWKPRGWWLDSAIELETLRTECLTNINSELGWFRELQSNRNVYQLPLDSDTQQLLQQPSWLGKNFMLVAFAQTCVNEALVACALERYQLAQGKLPTTLEELLPQFLDRVRTDVLRGRPLIYHRTSTSYTLRGVGQNLREDGDKPASDDWIWAFQLETPAQKK